MTKTLRGATRMTAFCAAILFVFFCHSSDFSTFQSSNIQSTNSVYAAMRAALHPRMAAQLAALDKEYNHHLQSSDPPTLQPSPLPSDRILDWIVHASLPGVTNETTFFNSYKAPVSVSTSTSFLHLLTNRASRLSYIPPIPQIKLANYTRPEPGVDYPGVSYEDEGTTPSVIRLTLRAPKSYRKFRIDVDVVPKKHAEYEVKWMLLQGVANVQNTIPYLRIGKPCYGHVGLSIHSAKAETVIAAVFVREMGKPWGTPDIIQIDADPLCVHHYDKKGVIEYIDYGSFRDVYMLDGQNRILGFERILPGMVRGDAYSNFGEKIAETYPDDKPKITRKVKYFVIDGKLSFEVLDGDIYYKNAPFQYRLAF